MQCDRSAYAGESSEVEDYFVYMKGNYPTKKWYRGERIIFIRPARWELEVWRESRMLLYLKLFLSSGIQSFFQRQATQNSTILRQKELKRGKNWKIRYATTSFQVVKLSDSIQTISILLLACLLACSCLALIEYVKHNWRSITRWVASIWTRYIKSVRSRWRKKIRRKTKFRATPQLGDR